MLRKCVFLLALVAIGFFVSLSCTEELYVQGFVDDRPTAGVLAAVDIPTCEALAADWHSGKWILKSIEYNRLVEQNKAVRLPNGTKVKRGERQSLQNGHLVPLPSYTKAGEPIPEPDITWIVPKEGVYQGRKLCVSTGAVRTNRAPPL